VGAAGVAAVKLEKSLPWQQKKGGDSCMAPPEVKNR
jgi:hypothetical protein